MAITTRFVGGAFEALKDGQVVVYQPFKPTATGEQPAWADEAEAMAWWETVKTMHGVAAEPPPAE